MWRFYVKSLQYSSSTFLPTVTNTASNFFFTVRIDSHMLHISCMLKRSSVFVWLLQALSGWFLFNEMLGLMWFAGMTLVFLGLALIHRDQVQSCTVNTESKKTKWFISFVHRQCGMLCIKFFVTTFIDFYTFCTIKPYRSTAIVQNIQHFIMKTKLPNSIYNSQQARYYKSTAQKTYDQWT